MTAVIHDWRGSVKEKFEEHFVLCEWHNPNESADVIIECTNIVGELVATLRFRLQRVREEQYTKFVPDVFEHWLNRYVEVLIRDGGLPDYPIGVVSYVVTSMYPRELLVESIDLFISGESDSIGVARGARYELFDDNNRPLLNMLEPELPNAAELYGMCQKLSDLRDIYQECNGDKKKKALKEAYNGFISEYKHLMKFGDAQ